MNKAEIAANSFMPINCAQAVLTAYAADYGLEKDKALQVAAAFGSGMGRLQETCGAVSGALIVLGLSSGFKEKDCENIIEIRNTIYAKTRDLISDFTEEKKSVLCRELLGCECDLKTEEGRKFYNDNNLQEKCRDFIRLACKLTEKHSF